MNMPDIFVLIKIFIFSYLFGSIPWGFLIARFKGLDLRKEGSGNIGATNVRRTLGSFYGRLCFLLDFLKGFLPVLAVLIMSKYDILSANCAEIGPSLAAIATVFGHNWTVFLGFKGGKGISTTAGALLVLSPLSLLVAGLIWAGFFFLFRYVSLASIAATLALPISAFLLPESIQKVNLTVKILLIVLALTALLRHKSNIGRLLKGTENKFERKKREAEK